MDCQPGRHVLVTVIPQKCKRWTQVYNFLYRMDDFNSVYIDFSIIHSLNVSSLFVHHFEVMKWYDEPMLCCHQVTLFSPACASATCGSVDERLYITGLGSNTYLYLYLYLNTQISVFVFVFVFEKPQDEIFVFVFDWRIWVYLTNIFQIHFSFSHFNT